MKLSTLIVPVDGSVLAETAVYRAVDLARETGARVLLLRAIEALPIPGAEPTSVEVARVREAEEYVAGVRARLEEGGFMSIDTSVWSGPPALAIVEAARVHGADLIVMTTHSRSGLGRLILGSVAESVLRGTDTPILLLRAPGAPLETPLGTACPTEKPHASEAMSSPRSGP